MMTRYEIPQGLNEEIRWFKYFSLRSLIIALCTAGIGILIGNLIKGLGISLYFIVFWIALTIAVTALTLFKIPNSNWLGGGGEYIDKHLIKILIRKRNKCIYLKGYNQQLYEQREKTNQN